MSTKVVYKVLIVILTLILIMTAQLTEQSTNKTNHHQNKQKPARPPLTTTNQPPNSKQRQKQFNNQSHYPHQKTIEPTPTTTTPQMSTATPEPAATTPKMSTTTPEPTTTTSQMSTATPEPAATIQAPSLSDESPTLREPGENATTTMNTTKILAGNNDRKCENDVVRNQTQIKCAREQVVSRLRIISIVGIGSSICCILLTFLIHVWLLSNMRNDRTTILMNLCVSLFFACIVFLAGIERTESKVACAIIAGFLLYLDFVVLFVMFVEGIQLAITVMGLGLGSRIKLLLIAAWVIPGIIVAVSAGVTKGNGYENETYCWFSTAENGFILSYVGPALFIISFNIICMIWVIRSMCCTGAMETKKVTEKVKVSARSLCVLVPVVCIYYVVDKFEDDRFVILQFMFTLLNGLQGLFVFIFHVLFNHQVGNAFALRKKRSTMK